MINFKTNTGEPADIQPQMLNLFSSLTKNDLLPIN